MAALPPAEAAAPGFDFGAVAQTNALLLQDAQTFITGKMRPWPKSSPSPL